ncbi:MAG: molybdenum cofactor guanylyltransferase [Bacteroidia bacterium]|jgi:molybdenum cofactor guanylyltransferase|nr:molybdenum cofactor guanylyltransferase [Sphingobacteriaceae bacterium]MBP9082331.1 molybdenum cofactor guanylyltransferase [Bacteroidia bacterium]
MREPIQINAYVLCGGKSTRMGTEKGLVNLQGKEFVRHITDTLKRITDSIAIIANNNGYERFGYNIIGDLVKEKGPLAGIYTGLMHSNKELNLFLSCDIPLVKEEAIIHLIESSVKNEGATVTEHNGKTEPLFAVYRKTQATLIKELLDKDELSVMNSLSIIGSQKIPLSGESFYDEKMLCNINTKKELEILEEELKWKI